MWGNISVERKKSSQLGFTMIEMMIAMALTIIVLAGTVAFLRQIVVYSGDSTDRSQARSEVQYVNRWIGEDVIQAQRIEIGNITGARCPNPFLHLEWTAGGVSSNVDYCVEDMKDALDRNMWKLYRTEDAVQITVGGHLDPLFTRCYQKQSGNGTPVDVLVLEVASKVDNMEASASFEINPRFGNVTWVVIP